MMHTVTIYMNVSEDNFFGYDHNDDLATADDLVLRVDTPDWCSAAERAYSIGNRAEPDTNGRSWPSDVRSVSVGDVVRVVADGANAIVRYTAVTDVGFELIEEPRYMVALAGTKATSR